MGEGVSERLIRQVVASTVGTCASCAEGFDEAAVSVVGHQEDLWFFSLVCDRCQARELVAAVVRESDGLAGGEVSPLDRSGKVSAEDVRAVHRFLDTFDGDFQALFS
jgi:hypothetical protein